MSGSRGVHPAISEMKEFSSFEAATQRYIRRSIDVATGDGFAAARWARNAHEASSIVRQVEVYARIPSVRAAIPLAASNSDAEALVGPLAAMACFDLAEAKLTGFSSFRFLYERIVCVAVRPWLPAAFLGAAALPHLAPHARGALLRSITESAATAAGWSSREPVFTPTRIEVVDA